MHLRHLLKSRHMIVEEVLLLDEALLDRDRLAQRQAEAVDDAAFGLRHHIVRLHGDAAVDRAPKVVHRDLATVSIERDLGDACDLCVAVIEVSASETATRAWARPLGHLRYPLDDFLGGSSVAQ